MPKTKKPKKKNLRCTPITAARLKKQDHYRCQVQMPRKWIYAVGHHFLLKALDTSIAVELRDCFGAKIEARYLAHLRTALSTPEARAAFREFCALNIPSTVLRDSIVGELGELLNVDLSQ
jgi:hypothetical protein